MSTPKNSKLSVLNKTCCLDEIKAHLQELSDNNWLYNPDDSLDGDIIWSSEPAPSPADLKIMKANLEIIWDSEHDPHELFINQMHKSNGIELEEVFVRFWEYRNKLDMELTIKEIEPDKLYRACSGNYCEQFTSHKAAYDHLLDIYVTAYEKQQGFYT